MTQGIAFVASDLLARAQLREAAEMIADFLKDKNRTDLEEGATMTIMRLNKLTHEYHVLKILSDEDAQQTYNQIGVALLELLKEVKALEKALQAKQQALREPAIESLVYAHMHAMLEKDLDGIMKTFHPEMPGWEENKNFYEQIFQSVDAVPELKTIRLLTRNDELAAAEVVQFTQSKIEDAPFRQNETTQVYLFRKHNGLWKIFHTILKKIEYFDIDDDFEA